ncbi:MAG: hypothetical protein IT342_18035 [Candidatus Melainabacteria bacterium]|nr:hypothetical protein [Candidatus Melainabacteria bacterium]
MDEKESEFCFDKGARESWSANEKRTFVFRRLQELRVDVQFKEDSLTIWVPFGMEDLALMEIGCPLKLLGTIRRGQEFSRSRSNL